MKRFFEISTVAVGIALFFGLLASPASAQGRY
jgi:hypothetical protein